MARYNLFGQVHKTLRSMLYETSIRLQQTNFSNEEDTAFALEKLNLVLNVFDKHEENEDNYILPAIRQYEPSVTDAFEKKHYEDHELAEKLRQLSKIYWKKTNEEDRLKIGRAINTTFTSFMNINIEHMGCEESVLNKILWRYYSDTEIMVINQRSNTSHEADRAGKSMSLLRGLTNDEIVGLLKAVEKNAPEHVFNSLFSIAEKELPGLRFNKVMESLTKGVLVA